VFVGDTLFRGAEGMWSAGYIPGVSDADALAATLDLLGALDPPSLVASSAFAGDHGAHRLDRLAWRRVLDEARRSLDSVR